MSEACKAAIVSKRPIYEWRNDDDEFRADWEAALETAADVLEREAWRRAAEGVEESVYHKGEQVGVVRKYSDLLLIFLLKGIRPTKYRENQRVEHTGAGGKDLTIVLREGEDVP